MSDVRSADPRVALVGHAGAGVSSLTRALAGGALPWAVTDGPDHAADLWLFVVSAAGGLDPTTQQLWEDCEDLGLPRLVALTHVDLPHTDVTETAALCARVFSDSVLTVALPVYDHDTGAPQAVLTLLDAAIRQPGTPARDADPEHLELISSDLDALIEAVIADALDDDLATDYITQGRAPTDQLHRELVGLTARGHLFPLLPVDVETAVGIDELIRLVGEVLAARPSD